MQGLAVLTVFLFFGCTAFAQGGAMGFKVQDANHRPLPHASVELLKPEATDSRPLHAERTDSAGTAWFTGLNLPAYIVRISEVNHALYVKKLSPASEPYIVVLLPKTDSLPELTVTAKKPVIEFGAGRMTVNVDAMPTAAGSSALEVLEKVPGVSVGNDGVFNLKGRAGALVIINGKQTYLTGTELMILLSTINASEIAQIEVMDNPPPEYEAAGSSGVINIKMKKNRQNGLSGQYTGAQTQGYYPKTTSNLTVNYYRNKVHMFFTHSFLREEWFNRVESERTYYQADRRGFLALFDGFAFLHGERLTNSFTTGADLDLTKRTSVGFALRYRRFNYDGTGDGQSVWRSPASSFDSSFSTLSASSVAWQDKSVSINFQHAFSERSKLTTQADALGYNIRNTQYVDFRKNSGAMSSIRGDVLSDLDVYVGKADYEERLGFASLSSGVKLTQIRTNNVADYDSRRIGVWLRDTGLSNHFTYKENTVGAYIKAYAKSEKLEVEGGLRFEATNYEARQLAKDSLSFRKSYQSLFPSLSLSFFADSANTFSVTAGRRIERPAFNKLNPFTYIVDRFSYRAGNPFFRPQYTWNLRAGYAYKSLWQAGLAYSYARDYFSQLYYVRDSGVILYTEGNIEFMRSLGADVSLQLSPARWWRMTAQANLNRKTLNAVLGKDIVVRITQYAFTLNNLFQLPRGWRAELSGVYNSRSQYDLQDLLDPAGQLSVGIAKSIANNKGTIRFSARDLFYTNWRKGFSGLPLVDERFKLTQDTRTFSLSLNWRFGTPQKIRKALENSATDETDRVTSND